MKKREKIYIIPTAYGFMYGGGIFVSLIGGAIYNNNLAFVLCFFLVALFLIGMVQTHNNLKSLDIEKVDIFLSPSQGIGNGVVWIKSRHSEGHAQLNMKFKSQQDEMNTMIEVIHKNSLHPQSFEFSTGEWGKKKLKRITLSTKYPFGFFYVWRYFQCSVDYYVYPSPVGQANLEMLDREGINDGEHRQKRGDDFSEHKKYEKGLSQKHIDWKAYARGRPLLVKKFDEGVKQTYWLDYDRTPGDEETKVRQLSQWIHTCEKSRQVYALKIKNREVLAGGGRRHKAQCLTLLASLREVE